MFIVHIWPDTWLCKTFGGGWMSTYWNYKFDGQYSKGKVYCSCPDCSAKSSRHGFKVSDIRKYEAAKASTEELGLRMPDSRCMHTHYSF